MNKKVTGGCINQFELDISFNEDSERYIGEVLQRHEYKYLLEHIAQKEDLIVVDIGANIGTFSFYIYDIASEIYAIEPFKEVIAMIEETVKQNKLDKIKTYTIAIGGTTGKGMMNRVEPVASGANFLDPEGKVEVDVMTLNDFADKEGITHIDILKIDTEGGEQSIMESTDFEKLPVQLIVGEFHPFKLNKHTFYQTIGDKGFKGIDVDGNRFAAEKL